MENELESTIFFKISKDYFEILKKKSKMTKILLYLPGDIRVIYTEEKEKKIFQKKIKKKKIFFLSLPSLLPLVRSEAEEHHLTPEMCDLSEQLNNVTHLICRYHLLSSQFRICVEKRTTLHGSDFYLVGEVEYEKFDICLENELLKKFEEFMPLNVDRTHYFDKYNAITISFAPARTFKPLKNLQKIDFIKPKYDGHRGRFVITKGKTYFEENATKNLKYFQKNTIFTKSSFENVIFQYENVNGVKIITDVTGASINGNFYKTNAKESLLFLENLSKIETNLIFQKRYEKGEFINFKIDGWLIISNENEYKFKEPTADFLLKNGSLFLDGVCQSVSTQTFPNLSSFEGKIVEAIVKFKGDEKFFEIVRVCENKHTTETLDRFQVFLQDSQHYGKFIQL